MAKNKKNLWPLLFIAIFGFTFAMVIWTIVSSSKATIIQDQSFGSNYHNVDLKYNQMYNSTQKLKSMYDIKVVINGNEFNFDLKDAFISARELNKEYETKKRKRVLHLGTNSFEIKIKPKGKNEIKDVKLNFLVINNIETKDIILKDFKKENNSYKTTFEIKRLGRWSITGNLSINNTKGYYYFKDSIIK